MVAESNPFASHETRVLKAHQREVNSVAWSCNGKRLATGSSDGCIKIWQPSLRITSKVERPETELTTAAGVNLLAWDPANPDRLLSVDLDKTLRLWDVKSARCLGSLKFSYSAQHAAWRPDGSDIVYLDSSDTLHVVSGATCKVTRSTRTKWKLNHFCFNADGTLLYVATTHKLLHVLSYDTFERVRSVAVHTDSILYVTMAPEDRFLCTGGSDASVAIIDVKDLVALHYLHCDGEIDHVSVSSDACWIAFNEWSSGNVTSSGLWIASSKTGRVQRVETKHPVSSSSWNPSPTALPVLAFAGGPLFDSRGDAFGPACIYAGPVR